jgi:hypothetical protein
MYRLYRLSEDNRLKIQDWISRFFLLAPFVGGLFLLFWVFCCTVSLLYLILLDYSIRGYLAPSISHGLYGWAG